MKDNFTLTIDEKNFKLYFNLNVMEELQEKYGSVDKWGELTDGSNGEVNAKALIDGLMAMINEGIDIDNEEQGTDKPLLTHKQVARLISKVGIEKATESLNKVVIESTKSDEKNA